MFINKVLLCEFLDRRSKITSINIIGLYEGKLEKQHVNLVLCSDASNRTGIAYYVLFGFKDGTFKAAHERFPLYDLGLARQAFVTQLDKVL